METSLPDPNIDWNDTAVSNKGRPQIAVICPHCGNKRYKDKGGVTLQVRRNIFSPDCYDCKSIGVKWGKQYYPEHPAVNWNRTQVRPIGCKKRLTFVSVTCPICKEERFMHPGSTAAAIRRGTYIGRCKKCGQGRSKDQSTYLSPGRFLDHQGYVKIYKPAVPESQYKIFDAMVAKRKSSRWQNTIAEHRFVMAIKLGRVLESYEMVDHMDGKKDNNDPVNLRLYIKGSQMPGSNVGYGTYYHEWQTALAEIARLKALLGSP